MSDSQSDSKSDSQSDNGSGLLRSFIKYLVGSAAMPEPPRVPERESDAPDDPLRDGLNTMLHLTEQTMDQADNSRVDAEVRPEAPIAPPAGPAPRFDDLPLRPPQNLFERVIESLMGFAAKVAGISVPEEITFTQAVLESLFGRVRTPGNEPDTISEALSLTGDKGLLGRSVNADAVNRVGVDEAGVVGRPSAVERTDGDGPPSVAEPVFAPINPPETLFERVVESLMGFAARIARLDVRFNQTATQTVLTKIFGQPASAAQAPRTIREAVSVFNPRGLIDRILAPEGKAVRAANSVRNSRIGQAIAGSRIGRAVAGSRIGQAIAGSRIGQAVSTAAMAGMSTAASAAGTALGGLVAGAVVATVALKQMAANSWAAINAVAKYNGTLRSAQLQLELGRKVRDINRAMALGPSGKANFEAQNRLEQALEWYRVKLLVAGNIVGTWAKNTAAALLEDPFGSVVEFMIPDSLLKAVGLGADADDKFVEAVRNVAGIIWDNPVGTVVDVAFPDELLEALGFGADADDEIIAYLKEMTDAVKKWFGVNNNQQNNGQGGPNLQMDQLALHNMMIGNLNRRKPPVPPLGAQP